MLLLLQDFKTVDVALGKWSFKLKSFQYQFRRYTFR